MRVYFLLFNYSGASKGKALRLKRLRIFFIALIMYNIIFASVKRKPLHCSSVAHYTFRNTYFK